MNIEEHVAAILTEDLPSDRLEAGDIGTVVMVHDQGAAYEVEFLTLAGETLAVLTLTAAQVRPAAADEIVRVRHVA
jgi:hypothetical protein